MYSERVDVANAREVLTESVPIEIDQLVINWHVNEACNYGCEYCFAKWSDRKSRRDLIKNPEETAALLAELWSHFTPANLANPLRKSLNWKRVRINFAGGEPMLNVPALQYAIRTAYDLGFDVSIITNGSKLDLENLSAMAPYLEWLGISIDAVGDTINRTIGRIDRRGQTLDLGLLSDAVQTAREVAPLLRLKFNTVVSAANWSEDLSPMIAALRPEKWKVLRVLPMVTEAGMVADQQFEQFVERHRSFASIMRVEDNSDMLKTYLMIDPKGRFFQNHPDARDTGYIYSRPILENGAMAAFCEQELSAEGFVSRYS